MCCAIWYHLYNLKNVKNTIFMFFKLYKWYQIAQSTTYVLLPLDDNVDEECEFSNNKSSESGYCLGFAWFFVNFSLALFIKVLLVKKRVLLTVPPEYFNLQAPTPQNGLKQTDSRRIVWVYLTILWGWRLKG